MHASSLIFLVIIALWAAYLVPGAIKRRRRTASARIADRDSAALRVVVRRAGAASAATDAGAPPVAVETSSRPVLGGAATPALPAVTVRSTGTAPAGRRGADVVRRRRRLVLLLLALSVAGAAAGALGLVPALPALLPGVALLLVLGALARHGASRSAAPVVVARPAPVPVPAVHVDETPTVLIDLREGARAVNE